MEYELGRLNSESESLYPKGKTILFCLLADFLDVLEETELLREAGLVTSGKATQGTGSASGTRGGSIRMPGSALVADIYLTSKDVGS